jgi:hypothetical protein
MRIYIVAVKQGGHEPRTRKRPAPGGARRAKKEEVAVMNPVGKTQKKLINEMIRNGGLIYSSDAVRTVDYYGRPRGATVGVALSSLIRLRERGIVQQLYLSARDVARLIEAGEIQVLDPTRAAEYIRSRPRGISWWILDPNAFG